MPLYFQNLSPTSIWIALVYGDSTCTGTPYRKQGWWEVGAGQTRNLYFPDLRTVPQAAFYAEEYKDSGGATWQGNGNNWYLISDAAFDQCYNNNENCNQQPDFIPLDFGQAEFGSLTVVLGPAPGMWTTHGPQLIANPQIVPPSYYPTFSFQGNTFPPNQEVSMYLAGLFERTAPLAIGWAETDANGNFQGGYGNWGTNSNPSPSVVLQAFDLPNNVPGSQLIASCPMSFGNTY